MKPLKISSFPLNKKNLLYILLGIIIIVIIFIIVLEYYHLSTPQPAISGTGDEPGSLANPIGPPTTYLYIICKENLTDNYTNDLIHSYEETKDGQKFAEDRYFKIRVFNSTKDDNSMISTANQEISIDPVFILSRYFQNETLQNLNQTIIAYNITIINNTTVKTPIVLITTQKPIDDVNHFINFILSPEGQSVLAKDGLIPLNNSSTTA